MCSDSTSPLNAGFFVRYYSPMSKLTPRQERFIDEYLIDLNATQAYIRAGYAQKRAHVNASRLMANENIQKEVAKRKAKIDQGKTWDAAWVRRKMQELYDSAEAEGNKNIQAKTLDMMSKVEAMQAQNHQVDGRTGITFNIKTGKK